MFYNTNGRVRQAMLDTKTRFTTAQGLEDPFVRTAVTCNKNFLKLLYENRRTNSSYHHPQTNGRTTSAILCSAHNTSTMTYIKSSALFTGVCKLPKERV